ncbi:hypothetical protein P7C70_g4048, partial [Phenoliferia sp. Uapishka_3]
MTPTLNSYRSQPELFEKARASFLHPVGPSSIDWRLSMDKLSLSLQHHLVRAHLDNRPTMTHRGFEEVDPIEKKFGQVARLQELPTIEEIAVQYFVLLGSRVSSHSALVGTPASYSKLQGFAAPPPSASIQLGLNRSDVQSWVGLRVLKLLGKVSLAADATTSLSTAKDRLLLAYSAYFAAVRTTSDRIRRRDVLATMIAGGLKLLHHPGCSQTDRTIILSYLQDLGLFLFPPNGSLLRILLYAAQADAMAAKLAVRMEEAIASGKVELENEDKRSSVGALIRPAELAGDDSDETAFQLPATFTPSRKSNATLRVKGYLGGQGMPNKVPYARSAACSFCRQRKRTCSGSTTHHFPCVTCLESDINILVRRRGEQAKFLPISGAQVYERPEFAWALTSSLCVRSTSGVVGPSKSALVKSGSSYESQPELFEKALAGFLRPVGPSSIDWRLSMDKLSLSLQHHLVRSHLDDQQTTTHRGFEEVNPVEKKFGQVARLHELPTVEEIAVQYFVLLGSRLSSHTALVGTLASDLRPQGFTAPTPPNAIQLGLNRSDVQSWIGSRLLGLLAKVSLAADATVSFEAAKDRLLLAYLAYFSAARTTRERAERSDALEGLIAGGLKLLLHPDCDQTERAVILSYLQDFGRMELELCLQAGRPAIVLSNESDFDAVLGSIVKALRVAVLFGTGVADNRNLKSSEGGELKARHFWETFLSPIIDIHTTSLSLLRIILYAAQADAMAAKLALKMEKAIALGELRNQEEAKRREQAMEECFKSKEMVEEALADIVNIV